MPDVFRRCASVVLLKSADVCSPEGCDKLHHVLLVHKPRKRDAWQLPQGGADEGESIEAAALRELFEETGITARSLGLSGTVYQYSFPESYRRFRPDNVCGQRVAFVFAEPVSDSVVRVDGDEIDGYVWALPEEIGKSIERRDYRRVVEGLVREGISLLSARR